jgi:ketosteroid isomerase-like protein
LLACACNQQDVAQNQTPASAPPATAAAAVQEDLSAKAVEEIMAADRAFNDEAQAQGLGPAFAKYMGEGMIFQSDGKILRGRDEIYEARNDGQVPPFLTWQPQEAYAGKSGDFGASWGTWIWDERAKDPSATIATGKYVTVWRKNEAGEWRGVMDLGVTDRAPAPAPGDAPEGTESAPGDAPDADDTQPGGPLAPAEIMEQPGIIRAEACRRKTHPSRHLRPIPRRTNEARLTPVARQATVQDDPELPASGSKAIVRGRRPARCPARADTEVAECPVVSQLSDFARPGSAVTGPQAPSSEGSPARFLEHYGLRQLASDISI